MISIEQLKVIKERLGEFMMLSLIKIYDAIENYWTRNHAAS